MSMTGHFYFYKKNYFLVLLYIMESKSKSFNQLFDEMMLRMEKLKVNDKRGRPRGDSSILQTEEYYMFKKMGYKNNREEIFNKRKVFYKNMDPVKKNAMLRQMKEKRDALKRV